MKKNVASWDRGLRLVVGLALGYFALVSLAGIWQVLAIVVGIVLLLTSVAGFCPSYSALGISTLKEESKEVEEVETETTQMPKEVDEPKI